MRNLPIISVFHMVSTHRQLTRISAKHHHYFPLQISVFTCLKYWSFPLLPTSDMHTGWTPRITCLNHPNIYVFELRGWQMSWSRAYTPESGLIAWLPWKAAVQLSAVQLSAVHTRTTNAGHGRLFWKNAVSGRPRVTNITLKTVSGNCLPDCTVLGCLFCNDESLKMCAGLVLSWKQVFSCSNLILHSLYSKLIRWQTWSLFGINEVNRKSEERNMASANWAFN